MNERRFKCDEVPSDFGKLLFECDESQTVYDTSKDKRKAMRRSPAFWLFIAIVAFMTGWFLYSLIVASIYDGFGVAVVVHIPGFVVLAVCDAICVLSAFGLWGRFMRFAFKHNLVRARGSEGRSMRELEKQLDAADERRASRNALSVYEDYIVVVKEGISAVYSRGGLEAVHMRNFGAGMKVEFDGGRGGKAFFIVCQSDAIEIRRIFKDKYVKPPKRDVRTEKASKRKKPSPEKRRGGKIKRVKPVCVCDKSTGFLTGATLIVLAAIGFGVATILLHYYVNEQVPELLGVFFILGGIVALLTVYDFVPIIHEFFVPFSAGALFVVAPILILGAIYSAVGLQVTLADIMLVFTPLNAGCAFLSLMGTVIVLYSFRKLYKYIRYGDIGD